MAPLRVGLLVTFPVLRRALRWNRVRIVLGVAAAEIFRGGIEILLVERGVVEGGDDLLVPPISLASAASAGRTYSTMSAASPAISMDLDMVDFLSQADHSAAKNWSGLVPLPGCQGTKA